MNTTHLKCAEQYSLSGWRIVPVHGLTDGRCSCDSANCRRAGKHPRIGSWTTKASADARKVAAWWTKWPQSNIGLATGADSGVVVLDIDGDAGRATLGELAGQDPSVLDTRIHRTGSGGSHLFYEHPGFRCGNSVRTMPGIDIRGDGGLIVLPPSLHKSGLRYQVTTDRPPAPLPDSLKPLFYECHKEEQRGTKSDEESRGEARQGAGRLEPSQQTATRRRQELEWALLQSLPTEEGKRHRQVFELARHLLSVSGFCQATPIQKLRPVIEEWHRMAMKQAAERGFTIHGDVEESWTDFRFAWGRVKHPIGGLLLKKVFDHVAAMDAAGKVDPTAWNALSYFRRTDDAAMRLLVGVLRELAQCCDPGAFRLACHAGATQFARLGIVADQKWLYRRLKTLTDEGVLACVDPGTSGIGSERRAAQYRWVWSPKDPPTYDFDELLASL